MKKLILIVVVILGMTALNEVAQRVIQDIGQNAIEKSKQNK
mgnify:CR=1 FL=1